MRKVRKKVFFIVADEVTLLVLLILTYLSHLLNHIVLTVFINHCAKPEYIMNTTPVQK